MIVRRRPGHIQVTHPDGRVARLAHPDGPTNTQYIYVRITPYVSVNWKRAECAFKFVAENNQESAGHTARHNAH